MLRTIFALALIATAFAAPALAGPATPISSTGTKIANAFSGCVVANCDVLRTQLPGGHAHSALHVVLASHTSGFPPAYNMGLRLVSGGGTTAIAGCPDIFTAGSAFQLQTCTVPAQPPGTYLMGFVEFLRPHQTGTVSFGHGLTAV